MTSKLIQMMPRVLSWIPSQDVLARIHADYEQLLFNALGFLLARLTRESKDEVTEICELINGLADDSLRRLLVAPEMSYRLFYYPDRRDEAASFIRTAMIAESHKLTSNYSSPDSIEWTVFGESCLALSDEKGLGERHMLGGHVPIDLDSP